MKNWIVVMATATVLAATTIGAFAQSAKEALASKGKLRVGVYPGSPTSLIHDPNTGESHGLTFELGKELARRLDVPFEQVNYQRISDVLQGMKAGDVDFTISNSTPARAVSVAFSQTLLTIELGYLVAANSPLKDIDDVRTSGLVARLAEQAGLRGAMKAQ